MNDTNTLYFGFKSIHAVPMNRREYNDYRGWEMPSDENGDDPGFLIEDADGGPTNDPRHAGYISWSPVDVFGRSYRCSGSMTFGMAIEAMKQGWSVQRNGGSWLMGMSDNQIPAAPTENKVTVEHIAGLIVSEEYIRPASASTLTICVLVLRNGFSVTGESACADPANFDAQIGKKIARAAAIEKIWMVEGYLLRQRLYEEKEMGQ